MHRLVGFTSFNLMLAHVVADHLGLRRRRRSCSLLGTCWDLTVRLPGHAAGRRRHAAPGHGGRHQSIRAARRRLRYESWHLLHLYAYLGVGLALPHQLWTGQPSSSPRPAATSSGGRPGPLAAGAVAGLAGRPAAWRATCGTGCGSRRGPRGPRRRLGLPDRSAPRPAAGAEAGQFFSWRFLGRAGLDPGQPVLAVRGARRPERCGSPSRTSVTAARSARALRPGTRVLVEGPYGRLTAAARTRPQGRADRRRRRHHPAARAGRGPRLRARRRVLLHALTEPRSSSASSTSSPRARARRSCGLPGRRRSDGLLAAASASTSGRRPDRAPALLGPRHRRARRLRLRPRGLDRRWSARPCRAGLPADRLHLETFAW